MTIISYSLQWPEDFSYCFSIHENTLRLLFNYRQSHGTELNKDICREWKFLSEFSLCYLFHSKGTTSGRKLRNVLISISNIPVLRHINCKLELEATEQVQKFTNLWDSKLKENIHFNFQTLIQGLFGRRRYSEVPQSKTVCPHCRYSLKITIHVQNIQLWYLEVLLTRFRKCCGTKRDANLIS